MPGPPSYLVYELTEAGNSLGAVLEALYAWGETAAPALGVKVEMVANTKQDSVPLQTFA